MQVIERGITPEGTKIQIEDWSNDYGFFHKNSTIALYPMAMNSIYKNHKSRYPYPERGKTFRISLDFDAEEDARDAFYNMVNGSKIYMDYIENYSSYAIPKADFIEAVTR